MLKTIISAAFLTTTFTIVTIGAVSVTGEQALAAKPIPVEAKRAGKLAEQCLLLGGKSLIGEEGNNPENNTLTLACCATNSEGVKWCVTCTGGTIHEPTDCSVITKDRVSLPGSLKPKPGQDQLAPTKDKPQIPSSMGNTLRPPAANAPTKDKPRLPPVRGNILMAPVTKAPTAKIPKTRLFFNQFKKRKK